MPRKKKEQANAQMEKDLQETLARHREEMARLAAEAEAQEPEPEPETTAPDVAALEEEEKPLEDPTIGQDISHNTELTMEQFFDKTRSLIQAASNALRTMEYKYDVVARKLDTVSRHLRHRDAFERALGFQYVKESTWMTPRLNKCPYCGKQPSLQMEKDGTGWLVICEECWTRAETANGPMAAVKNWNEGKETEVSRMVNRPLSET